MSSIVIEHLADRHELRPTLQAWFESEWPTYYGPSGPGSAERDLRAYANRGSLPLGLVAFQQDRPCGFAALKQESFPSHPQLLPWVGAAYVEPSMRRQGIGRLLLLALEPEAQALGYSRIYCATATSASLLARCGWRLREYVEHEREHTGIYEKTL